MMKYSSEERFFRLWLCAASLVTVLRFLHAASPGYDLGIQIEAAQNLLAGKGLSIYRHVGPDLADPASLVTLTHFPSGYSLAAGALFALNLSVAMVVKLLGAAGTVLGWWGWARLAAPFFNEGMKRSSSWKWAGLTIATITPLLFTPWWEGTDIFLWAAIPWVLDYVVRAADETAPPRPWLDGLAGALCGFALLMRYASLFLAVYAACVILWQSRLRIAVLTRRWAWFGLGLLPALTFQAYVNYFLSNSPATPGGLSLNVSPGAAPQRLWDGVVFLYTANYSWAFWVPGRALTLLVPEVAGAAPWQLGIALIGLIVLALAVKTYGSDRTAASRDPRVVALGLFVALPLTLLGCGVLSPYQYVRDQRYYWPIVPLSVFVVYSLASRVEIPSARKAIAGLPALCLLYLTGYIAMSLAYVMFLFVPGNIGASQRSRLMGSALSQWPSMAVAHESSPARRLVMGLLKERPETLLVTSRAGWFYWDPAVDRSRLYELSCGDLRATYLSGPARIVILTFDEGQAQELPSYHGNGIHGVVRRAECFERLSDRRVVQRFPEEGLKVLEARVEAGQHVMLKP